jgi:hypothetical protein
MIGISYSVAVVNPRPLTGRSPRLTVSAQRREPLKVA